MDYYDVFISYSFVDREHAETLSNFLESKGYSTWFAQKSFKQPEWRRSVESALRSSAVVIPIITSNASESDEVQKECELASNHKKCIFPFVLQEEPLPYQLANYHVAKALEDIESARDQTLEYIEQALSSKRAHELASIERSMEYLSSSVEKFISLTYESISAGVSEAKDGWGVDLNNILKGVMERVDVPRVPPTEKLRLLEGPFSNLPNGNLRRAIVIGEPGAGKSTTLQKLFEELAELAKNDKQAPIPIIIQLASYSGQKPLEDHIKYILESRGDDISIHLDELLSSGRVALLLDGLSEGTGNIDLKKRSLQILIFLKKYRRIFVCVSCIASEYTSERDLNLELIQIAPLSPIQVREIIKNYCENDEEAEEIFWSLLGDPKAKEYLADFLKVGGNEVAFWTYDGPSPVPEYFAWNLWKDVRDNPLGLLSLAKNTFLLVIIITIFRSNKKPTSNRFELFSMFFEVVSAVAQNKASHDRKYCLSANEQIKLFSKLSKKMLLEQTLEIPRLEALSLLGDSGPLLLDIGEREKILSRGGAIGYTHQLFRAFFASFFVEQTWNSSDELDGFPNPKGWWKKTLWDEAFIFLVGKHGNEPIRILSWLRDINPELTSRCIAESGCRADPNFISSLSTAWISRLNSKESPLAMAAIGRALGRLRCDSRPGVCLVDEQGLPVIEWAKVPNKHFDFASAGKNITVENFSISKYMITNTQFDCFINDGGYTELHRDCWTEAGWRWKEFNDRASPDNYTEVFRLSNHPRIGTIWYEVSAYSRWLTKKLKSIGELGVSEEIRLPTETEWEAASRGPEGKNLYPWGDEFEYSKCNVRDLKSTTAVGVYPQGSSFEGVNDLVGNAWSWCLTKWSEDPWKQDNNPEGEDSRVYRGGSWAFDFNVSQWKEEELRCDQRYWIVPLDDRPDAIGFYVVKGSCLNA